jgi:putative phosphoesterase
VKIGILADTHIPDRLPEIPSAVNRAFKDLDIILHAGDICQLEVLRALQERYTLTFAVYGEHDDEKVRQYLLASQVVEFRSRRIGLIHGAQNLEASWFSRLRLALRPPPEEQYLDFLRSQFDDGEIHCIVYGHTHQPNLKFHNGVLFFNPGAVAAGRGNRATVGVLDVSDRSVTADVITL